MYKHFWKQLKRSLRLAISSVYKEKEKKLQLLKGRKFVMLTVWTKREVMPECVLQIVRGLYRTYRVYVPHVGHKWYEYCGNRQV